MKALMIQENRIPTWDFSQIAFVDPEALQLPPDVFMHRQRGKASLQFQDIPRFSKRGKHTDPKAQVQDSCLAPM
jgi:hypothetical protein